MENEKIIKGLEKVSKDLFDKKDFQNAGKINIAIDVLKELKL